MISPFYTFSGTISREAERRISVEGTKLAMQLGLNEGAERRVGRSVVGWTLLDPENHRKSRGKPWENGGFNGIELANLASWWT